MFILEGAFQNADFLIRIYNFFKT